MADARDTLVVLTIAYPFGKTWEPFLDPELPVLAQRFDRVIVVPSQREDHVRSLPDDVECQTFLADIRLGDITRLLLRHPVRALRRYARAVVDEGSPEAYLRHPLIFIGIIGRNLVKAELLTAFVEREGLHEATFYDYWLVNSSLALADLRRVGAVRRAVARAHGFDLYDERSRMGAVPFRSLIVGSLDRVFAISAHGLSYLAARHPEARGKLVLSRLGVESQPPSPRRRDDPAPLVVSCAAIKQPKLVHLIPEVLKRIDRPLSWLHFGDGPMRTDVELAAAGLPAGVTWRLMGHVEHSTLIDFYRRNRVDLFISLSASEGLPVSMMEATSFGIPVLATDVGGVPEIVNAHTGRLVSVKDPPEVVAAAARDLLDGLGPGPDEIIAFFRENFDAKTNFERFADLLHPA